MNPKAAESRPAQPLSPASGTAVAPQSVPTVERLTDLMREAGSAGISHRSICTAYRLWNTPGERLIMSRIIEMYDRLKPSGRVRSDFQPLKQGPAPWGGIEFAIQESRYYFVSYPGSEIFD